MGCVKREGVASIRAESTPAITLIERPELARRDSELISGLALTGLLITHQFQAGVVVHSA
jgi:hypothetical protein